jgi:hypothetical protein
MAWAWNVFPKKPGRYLALASIEIHWFSRAGGPPIYHALWQHEMEIEVVQPWITAGQLNVIGVLGGALLLGAVIEAVRQWLARRQQSPPSQPSPPRTF